MPWVSLDFGGTNATVAGMSGPCPSLHARIIAALTSVAPDAEIATLDPHRSFRDQIEIDSVDFLNFVLTLEHALDVRVPETDYPRLSSLTGCLTYLPTLLATTAPLVPPSS